MEKEISLKEYVEIVFRRWVSIVFITVLVVVSAYAATTYFPKVYRVESIIYPIESSSGGITGGAFAAAQLLGLSGGGGASSIKKIELFLRSHDFAKKLVRNKELRKVVFQDNSGNDSKSPAELLEQENTEADTVLGLYKLVQDPSNMVIKIAAESGDPHKATVVSKAVLEELQHYLNDNTLTKARRNRVFIGKQILKIQKKILEDAKKLAQYNGRQGISPSSSRVDVLLTVDDTFLSSDELMGADPDRFESATTVKNVPQQAHVNFVMQEDRIHAELYALLRQQYETAKIEEQRENIDFEILSAPREPKLPETGRIQLVRKSSILIGLFLGLFYAFLAEYFKKVPAVKSREVESVKNFSPSEHAATR